jgi:hypothetical protein
MGVLRTAKKKTARYTRKSYKLEKAQAQGNPTTNSAFSASLGPMGLYILIGFFAVVALAILIAVIASAA